MAETDDGNASRAGADCERFLVDAMCGKLARYLRMCGHDTAYTLDRDVEADDDILALADAEDRRLLSRDRELAARTEDAIALEARDVRDQLRTLADAGVPLELPDEPRRCGACNGILERVRAGESTPEYVPDPAEEDVWRCVDCGQCFWRGSHWDDVAGTLEGL